MPSDTPARCEPPEALRKVDGWHWVQPPERPWQREPEAVYWRPRSQSWSNPVNLEPAEAWERGHRYLSPVPSPSEIATLVRTGRPIANDPKVVWHADGERLHALSAALDAPSFKEIGDGE